MSERDELGNLFRQIEEAMLGVVHEEGKVTPAETALEKYYWITADHDPEKENSIIRLRGLQINDFKGVKHGQIDFLHGRKVFTPATKSDVLGIYGQNGSGKTAVVEAIKLVKLLMSGEGLHTWLDMGTNYSSFSQYGEWINKDSDYASFIFVFDEYYQDKYIRSMVYSFSLVRADEYTEYVNRSKAYNECKQSDYDDYLFKHTETRAFVVGERLLMGGLFNGEKIKMQEIIHVSDAREFFTPASKHKFIVGNLSKEEKDAVSSLMLGKIVQGSSTIFTVLRSGLNNDYARAIRRLKQYAMNEINIIGNDGLNAFESSTVFSDEIFPIYTPGKRYSFSYIDSTNMTTYEIDRLEQFIESINPVVDAVIPGTQLSLEYESAYEHQEDEYVKEDMEDENGYLHDSNYVDLYVLKNGNKVPYRCESIGTRRLISEISMFVEAYNNPKSMLVIDEFDAGIFEFLLGELLQIFEESGKGQFIFTSHNLRPLEVLDKRCICFTTTNSENRYIRLKNIGQTNNLRSTYFREILLGDQDEELYKSTKKHKLMAAMKKAGK